MLAGATAGLTMRKIRVFHLIKSLNRGGAETLLAEGLRFADLERFELSYGYFDPALKALVQRLRDLGAQVTCFDATNHASMLLRARRVARHLRAKRIDLVHCHLPTAGAVGRIAGRMAGVPVVYTEHNKVEWYRHATFWLNAWTYGWQERVIAVSDSVRDSIETFIRPTVPITVVRNGIDATHFTRYPQNDDPVRKRFGIPDEALVIGNVAALIQQKRVHDWTAAARLIHERHTGTRFLWVGEGPLEQELQDAISRLGLQDIFHLSAVQPDVRPFLTAMDLYMMSSAFEGLPVALLEAMAMGCAPVCTAVGGIPEVIRHGENGYLTEAGRPEELAGRVGELLANTSRIRLIAARARRRVEEDFRIERMVRAVEAIYLEVLHRPLTSC